MKPRPKVLYNKGYYRKNQIKSQDNLSKLYKQYKKKGFPNYHKQRDGNNANVLNAKISQETLDIFIDGIRSRFGKLNEEAETWLRYETLFQMNKWKDDEKRFIDEIDKLRLETHMKDIGIIQTGDDKNTLKKPTKEKSFVRQSISTSALSEIFLNQTTTDKWLTSSSFWIPRRIREAVIGDIMEDCHELRALGKKEYRVRLHILWHLILFALSLLPTAIIKAFKEKVVSE